MEPDQTVQDSKPAKGSTIWLAIEARKTPTGFTSSRFQMRLPQAQSAFVSSLSKLDRWAVGAMGVSMMAEDYRLIKAILAKFGVELEIAITKSGSKQTAIAVFEGIEFTGTTATEVYINCLNWLIADRPDQAPIA